MASPGVGRSDRSTFLRLLSFLSPFKMRVALSVLSGFATVACGIGLMATASFLIATAALHPSVAELAVPIVGVRFFGISRGGFRYLDRYLSHSVNFRLLARLRVWFYQTVEPHAPAGMSRHRSGDLLARVVGDVDTLQNLYVRVAGPVMVALLTAAGMGIFMAAFHPLLAGILLLFLALAGLALPLGANLLGRKPGSQMAAARSELQALLVDGLQGMSDLIAFDQEGRWEEMVRASSRRWLGIQERMAGIVGLHSAAGTLLGNLGMLAVLAAAIPLVNQGRLEGLFLPVVALAALASFEAVLPLPLAFQHLQGCLEAGRRLFEIAGDGTEGRGDGELTGRRGEGPDRISRMGKDGQDRGRDVECGGLTPLSTRRLDAASVPGRGSNAETQRAQRETGEWEGEAPTEPLGRWSPFPGVVAGVPAGQVPKHRAPGAEGQAPALRPRGVMEGREPPALSVEKLNFRYSPDEPLVLENVSFELPPGGRLAVVGSSGAGKSTLIHLLLRFWEYQEGSIRVAGRDLRDYDPEQLRSLFAMVSQRTHLFNTTIRENLLIARPEATEEELVQAARRAQIHSFVESLPQGFETQVGEHGLRLSGGERQRLAIARAILKDAPFLLLDEPTAHLDGVTESKLLEELLTLAKGRTTLIVTHRLVGLEEMAEILVLDAGKVVERGSQHQLLLRKGAYRRLWERQRQLMAGGSRDS